MVIAAAAAAIGVTLLEVTDRAETPAGSGVLWRGDFETGDFSQYEGVVQYARGRASIVDSPVRQGSHAARIEVREGEFIGSDGVATPTNPVRNRTMLNIGPPGNRHAPVEGSDWWYGWWFYVPSSTPLPVDGQSGFMIIASWPSTEKSTAPEINGHIEIRDTSVGGDDGPGYSTIHYEDGGSRADGHKYFWRKRTSEITRDTWHKLMVHKKYSANEAVGFVEIWFDGVQQTLQTDAAGAMGPRAFHRTLRPGATIRNHYGIYRTNSLGGTGVMYLDGLRIGTRRESVED